MCRKGGSIYAILAAILAVGVLLGALFPSGFLVLLLSLMVIAVGVLLIFF